MTQDATCTRSWHAQACALVAPGLSAARTRRQLLLERRPVGGGRTALCGSLARKGNTGLHSRFSTECVPLQRCLAPVGPGGHGPGGCGQTAAQPVTDVYKSQCSECVEIESEPHAGLLISGPGRLVFISRVKCALSSLQESPTGQPKPLPSLISRLFRGLLFDVHRPGLTLRDYVTSRMKSGLCPVLSPQTAYPAPCGPNASVPRGPPVFDSTVPSETPRLLLPRGGLARVSAPD